MNRLGWRRSMCSCGGIGQLCAVVSCSSSIYLYLMNPFTPRSYFGYSILKFFAPPPVTNNTTKVSEAVNLIFSVPSVTFPFSLIHSLSNLVLLIIIFKHILTPWTGKTSKSLFFLFSLCPHCFYTWSKRSKDFLKSIGI